MIEGPQVLDGLIDVSRETTERLVIFERLLRQWQQKTNLVGTDTLDRYWSHHVGDGAFLYAHASRVDDWTDIGAGAGLPGLIVAILAAGDERAVRVDLVESTAKKCAFQRAAVLEMGLRETSAAVGIHPVRIADFKARPGSLLTARALASLTDLIGHMKGLGLTRALFLKGERYADEVAAARSVHEFECSETAHPLHAGSVLLDIRL